MEKAFRFHFLYLQKSTKCNNNTLERLPFDATRDNVSTTEDYSIEAWFYLNTNTADATIACSVSSWSTQINYLIEVRASGDLRYWAGDAQRFATGIGYIKTGTWNHVCATRVSGTTYLFNLLAEHPEVCVTQPSKPEPKYFLKSKIANFMNKIHFKIYFN